MFSSENWTHARYTNGSEQMAMIALGAEADGSLLYFLGVYGPEGEEIYQEEYPTLDQALAAGNRKFHGKWPFKDLTKTGKTGGCASCVAH